MNSSISCPITYLAKGIRPDPCPQARAGPSQSWPTYGWVARQYWFSGCGSPTKIYWPRASKFWKPVGVPFFTKVDVKWSIWAETRVFYRYHLIGIPFFKPPINSLFKLSSRGGQNICPSYGFWGKCRILRLTQPADYPRAFTGRVPRVTVMCCHCRGAGAGGFLKL